MKEIQTIIRVRETQATTRAATTRATTIRAVTELNLLMKSARKWIREAVTTLTEIQATTIQTEILAITRIQATTRVLEAKNF